MNETLRTVDVECNIERKHQRISHSLEYRVAILFFNIDLEVVKVD
jgi:hypothetical protein